MTSEMNFLFIGRVLVVGDGDFSFSLSLSNKTDNVFSDLTTSNLNNEETIRTHKQAAENIDSLQSKGIKVCLSTDARDLHNHEELKHFKYDTIAFNFPLADRHNIRKNRALLADFFSSATQVLAEDGHILVTLCKGQGGTPADEPRREWANSWQITAMAANSGLVLTQVLPFDSTSFPEYHSVGFRFQDKSFHTEGALIHVFKVSQLQLSPDVSVQQTVQVNGLEYFCSTYVAEKIKRNLLLEERHPICLLKNKIELTFRNCLNMEITSENSFLIENYKTDFMYLKACDSETEMDTGIYSDKSSDSSSQASDKLVNETKELEENISCTKDVQENIVHGIESSTSEINTEQLQQSILVNLLPKNYEHVYVLVRKDSSEAKDTTENYQMVYHYQTSLLEKLTNLLPKITSDYLLMSGDCMMPVDINNCFIPKSHQIMIVKKIEYPINKSKDSGKHLKPEMFEITNILQKCINSSTAKLSISEHKDYLIKSETIGELLHLGNISCERSDSQKKELEVGLFISVNYQGNGYLVCLLHLDFLLCQICGIKDWRLLYSKSKKFTSQFLDSAFPISTASPCLYPLQFVHDLSFWEKDNSFSEAVLLEVARNIAGDCVVRIHLIDKYTDTTNSRVSRCYRLHFQSCDSALSYLTSWKIQSLIRTELARSTGITLR